MTDPAAPSAKPARVTPEPTTKPKPAGATTSKPKATTKPTTPKAKPKVASAAVARPKAASSKVTAVKPAAAVKSRPGLPARDKPAGHGRKESLDIARRVVELAEDKKAAEIVLLDLGELTTLADAFVICSGGSERQLDAIADGIVSGLREQGVRPIGREGVAASHWVLLDFGGVIVHIFTPPERDFYELEKHWSEARTVLRVQ